MTFVNPDPSSAAIPAGEVSVWNVANALTMLRLLVLPPTIWCLFQGYDVTAVALLVIGGVSDYVDGKIARHFHQATAFGAMLDPLADKLTLAGIAAAFTYREMVPVWALVVIVVRESIVAASAARLRSRGYGGFDVSFVGKAGTFGLLASLPLFVAGALRPEWPAVVGLAWACAAWGTYLYVVAAGSYARQAWIHTSRPAHSTGP